jgi:hypothetical protein
MENRCRIETDPSRIGQRSVFPQSEAAPAACSVPVASRSRLCDTLNADSHPAPGWRNWQTQRTQNPPIARSWGFDPPSRHQQKTKDLDGLNMGCFSGWPGGCGRVAVSHRQLVIWRQIGVSGRHGGGERSRANDERIKNGKKLAPYGNSNSLHRKNMRTCKIEGSICIEKE